MLRLNDARVCIYGLRTCLHLINTPSMCWLNAGHKSFTSPDNNCQWKAPLINSINSFIEVQARRFKWLYCICIHIHPSLIIIRPYVQWKGLYSHSCPSSVGFALIDQKEEFYRMICHSILHSLHLMRIVHSSFSGWASSSSPKKRITQLSPREGFTSFELQNSI